MVIAMSLSLCACSSAQSSITDGVDGLIQTASGKITDVKRAAENITQPVLDTVDDIEKKIHAVGSGVTKVQDGIEQLKGAIGVE